MFRILSNAIIEWSLFNFLTMYWWPNACHIKKTQYELSRLFSFVTQTWMAELREREREREREKWLWGDILKKRKYIHYINVYAGIYYAQMQVVYQFLFFFLIFTIFHKYCFNFSKLNGVILANQLRCRVYFT